MSIDAEAAIKLLAAASLALPPRCPGGKDQSGLVESESTYVGRHGDLWKWDDERWDAAFEQAATEVSEEFG